MASAVVRSVKMCELDVDFCTAFELQLEKVISNGMCGEVVLTKKEGYKLVVKKFSLLDKNRNIRNKEVFFTEAKFMQSFNHPFIMKCIIAGQCPEYMAICMDYLKAGTLLDYVGTISRDLSELCVTQVACALRYLHKHSVVHLDVKLENIFMDMKFDAILGDFGLAVEMAPQQQTLLNGQFGGTTTYFAPERIAAPMNKELDPYKLDSYCLGVVLWALVTGRYPGENINYYTEARRSRDLHTNTRSWLLKLLDRCPSRRPTVTDFLTRLRQEGLFRRVIDKN